MKRRPLIAFIVLVIICAVYTLWSRADRRPPDANTDLRLTQMRSVGKDVGQGNLLGVQPFMTPADYASEVRFYSKLSAHLAAARAWGFIGRKTIVVFPEYLGAWLVCAEEKRGVYTAKTTGDAIRLVFASNLAPFGRQFLANHMPDRMQCALFRMKGRAMARIYQRAFSRLAKQYGVTIVAGSIILPDPRVTDGAVVVGDGPLYNVCAVYGPDGRARAPIIRKAFPTSAELKFMAAGKAGELPVFDTPAGRLGVLICADSWYPAAYRRLKQQRVEIIAAPCYLYPANAWQRPWPGYQGGATPGDVNRDDPRHITEGQAWGRYALMGRMEQSGAAAGLQVFLRGRFWDLGADGQTAARRGETRLLIPRADTAALLNVWVG